MRRQILIVSMLLVVFSLNTAWGDLVENGDGTVTDSLTGLMWQQESAGPMGWLAAAAYCRNLALAGNGDWRLPSREALESILDGSRNDPAVNTYYFPDTQSSPYWSSDTVAGHDESAWHVNFGRGHAYHDFKSNTHYVRAVRNAQ